MLGLDKGIARWASSFDGQMSMKKGLLFFQAVML